MAAPDEPVALEVPARRCRVEVSRAGFAPRAAGLVAAAGALERLYLPLRPQVVDAPRPRLEWVRVPAGDDVAGFEMTRSEVTVAQYRACVAANACTEPLTTLRFCNWTERGRDDHPVNYVTWHQAQAFARWVGARLPSAAEWRHAAASGPRGWPLPWGREAPSCERVVMDGTSCLLGICSGEAGCGERRTWPVCSRPRGASAQGVCDLAGNVSEWVADCVEGPGADCPSHMRVALGGGWSSGAEELSRMAPEGRVDDGSWSDVGFRLVR